MNEKLMQKASVMDLKAYDDIMGQMKALNEESPEWAELADKLTSLYNSRDWFPEIFTEGGKEGLKNLDGSVMVPAIYDHIAERYSILYFRESIPVPVVKDGMYGVSSTDGSGELVIGCKHDHIEGLRYAPGYYVVTDGGRKGLWTQDGTMCIPQVAEAIYEPCNDIISFKAGDKFGLIDFKSGVYVEPLYEEMETLPDEPVMVVKDGVKGYLSYEDGRFVSQEEADCEDFSENLISADV